MSSPGLRYRVIFKGDILPGRSIEEVKKKLAVAFRLSPDAMEKYFAGRPLVIKSNIDLQSAEKYKAVFEKAGASCTIAAIQPEPVETTPSAAQQTAEEAAPARSDREAELTVAAADGPRVIQAPQKAVSLQYTPLQCRALTPTEGGLNFNRFGSESVSFGDILLASVYNLTAGLKPKTKIMFFIKTQKKPLMVDADTVGYTDLITQDDSDIYMSVRKFIRDLSSTNPALRIDQGTQAFLAGSSPETIKRDEAFHASALGAALDSGGLFDIPVPTGIKPAQKTLQGADAAPGGHDLTPEREIKTSTIYLGIAGAVLLVLIISVAVVVSVLKKKQERATEMINAPMIMPMMPGQGMPPGFPQSPEQAMQMAHDNMAMAELKNACTAAMVFLNEEHEGRLSLEALEQFGYRRRPEVQISIIDPSPDNLRMSARHSQGSRMIYADKDCRIN